MTRKDYIKIADILRSKRFRVSLSSDERSLLDLLAQDFADMLAEDNPRFDREQFLEAAGTMFRQR